MELAPSAHAGAIVGAVVEIFVSAIVGALVAAVVAITLTIMHYPSSTTLETSISTLEQDVSNNRKFHESVCSKQERNPAWEHTFQKLCQGGRETTKPRKRVTPK